VNLYSAEVNRRSAVFWSIFRISFTEGLHVKKIEKGLYRKKRPSATAFHHFKSPCVRPPVVSAPHPSPPPTLDPPPPHASPPPTAVPASTHGRDARPTRVPGSRPCTPSPPCATPHRPCGGERGGCRPALLLGWKIPRGSESTRAPPVLE